MDAAPLKGAACLNCSSLPFACPPQVDFLVGMITRSGLVELEDVEPFIKQFDTLDADGAPPTRRSYSW